MIAAIGEPRASSALHPLPAPMPDLAPVFQRLRAILTPYGDRLVVVHDTPERYYVDTTHTMPNAKPLFFGAASIGKRHVSFHLMPVYLFPDLLDGIPDALRSRMQGKSCFNFKAPDEALLAALADLTARGFERYREAGYVS
jgi:hypothetical protein